MKTHHKIPADPIDLTKFEDTGKVLPSGWWIGPAILIGAGVWIAALF